MTTKSFTIFSLHLIITLNHPSVTLFKAGILYLFDLVKDVGIDSEWHVTQWLMMYWFIFTTFLSGSETEWGLIFFFFPFISFLCLWATLLTVSRNRDAVVTTLWLFGTSGFWINLISIWPETPESETTPIFHRNHKSLRIIYIESVIFKAEHSITCPRPQRNLLCPTLMGFSLYPQSHAFFLKLLLCVEAALRYKEWTLIWLLWSNHEKWFPFCKSFSFYCLGCQWLVWFL